MSTPKGVDHFSRLPPELLQDIFDRAHDYKSESKRRRVLGPPSRFLKPFFDHTLYSRVWLDACHRLTTLYDSASDENLNRIRVLEIDFDLSSNSRDEGNDPEEDDDPGDPDNRVVTQLFKLTRSIEVLKISGSTRLALLVLSSSVAVSSLRNLQTLILASTFDSLDDPFHPGHYIFIPYYPSLRALHLKILRHEDSIENASRPADLPLIDPFRRLHNIEIDGPFQASRNAPFLLSSAWSCSKLTLVDSDENSRVMTSIELLPNPDLLEELVVQSSTLTTRREVVASFSRFSNLRSLSIKGDVDLKSPSIYQDLERLSALRYLHFGHGIDLALEQLLILVPRLTLSTLKLDKLCAISSVEMPDLWALRRRRINRADDRDQDELKVEIIRPDWSNEFSREGFKKLVRTCEAAGTELRGSTLNAFRIEEKFDSGELEKERIARLQETRRRRAEGHAGSERSLDSSM
ncbi:uncharacterized protein JCM6883_003511 [Sporobolomyces salmoneus]|uniref:uncharacterized protein n=1 Tax=Sporobolomyces salmoneus TaxID=183962 RepID=UPI003182939E